MRICILSNYFYTVNNNLPALPSMYGFRGFSDFFDLSNKHIIKNE